MADQENEQRLRLEQAALASKQQEDQNMVPTNQEVLRRNKLNQKKQQVCDVFILSSQKFYMFKFYIYIMFTYW